MKKFYFAFTTIIITFLVILSYLNLNWQKIATIEAGAEHNVSGWAWSENIGWISFNNLSGGGSVNYGVNIDSQTGNFSGYAWSENIGWIQFAPAGPYPASPNYSVKVDLGTKQITGWARALAYGDNWDGWIKFGYGPSGSYIDNNNDFHGWAWGSDVGGWISLNHADTEAGGRALYKVRTTFTFNQPPSASNLQANLIDGCLGAYYSFSWTFTDPGDSQSAYQVQVDNNSNFSSPEIDSGKISSGSNAYAPTTQLSWNTKYYWRLMVWDSKDTPSAWQEGSSFTTPQHRYPQPDFSWVPQSPGVKDRVDFTDKSTCYNPGNNPYSCQDKSTNSYLWDFGDGNTSSQRGNTSHTYNQRGNYPVKLAVTNDVGTCRASKTIKVGLPLWQRWREIIPF